MIYSCAARDDVDENDDDDDDDVGNDDDYEGDDAATYCLEVFLFRLLGLIKASVSWSAPGQDDADNDDNDDDEEEGEEG